MCLIQSVKMNSWRAIFQQVTTLFRGVFNAEFGGGGFVVANGVELCGQWGRNAGAAHGGKFFDLVRVQDRHDAGDERDLHALFVQVIAEFIKSALSKNNCVST